MEIKEFKIKLNELEDKYYGDTEAFHIYLDKLLIEYINDDEITEKFKKYTLWYS